MIANRKQYEAFQKYARYDEDGMLIGVKKDAPAGARKEYERFRKAQAEQEERMYAQELKEGKKTPARRKGAEKKSI